MTAVRNDGKGSDRDINDKKNIRNLTLYLLCALLVLLCVIVRILIEYKVIHLDETLSKVVSDVLSGILASALIAPIFAYFSDRSLMLWIGTTVSDHLRETLNALDAERAAHLPSHVFDSQLRYDPRFNEVISADFDQCSFFSFHGQTARYVALRMGHTRAPHFRRLFVRVPYPTLPATVESAVSQRLRLKAYSGWDAQSVRLSLLDDILFGLIGCFNRVVSRADVMMIIAPVSPYLGVRTEILDTACYISMYDTDKAGQSAQPETIRYSQGSMMHKIFYQADDAYFHKVMTTQSKSEAHRIVDGVHCFVFSGSSTPELFVDVLQKMGFEMNKVKQSEMFDQFRAWEKQTLATVSQ